ncbi:bifunctional glycosyltransferase family 2/GtrA family protein [Candidatus Magnetomonas plexicatena]|uniref:bifunctional glycosyltransferase family 2/GtrA family protein n=1 Tax=Candidatus Magnetomonas plexicatena TaxID=2552947 RepID=UPI001C769F25|nr:glycosyltransferase [Nitrospirales bacterium LBB_01]
MNAAVTGGVVVLIPAYNPDVTLLTVVTELADFGFEHLIVVDDGSSPECAGVFDKLKTLQQCSILRHAKNLGKGRALKTGFNYFCLNYPDSIGIVTADADGQHLPADIVKVSTSLCEHQNKLILGARAFTKDIPFRSYMGNVITRYVFWLLIGKKFSDTQTGLRGIPLEMVKGILDLGGERYEYEVNMLIYTKIKHVPIVEEPISTVYIENNRSSHFNPLYDSMKIYFLLIRFAFSSLFASLLDFILFTILYKLTASILISFWTARFSAGTLNFFINKQIVFKNSSSAAVTLVKYITLTLTLGTVSFLLINFLAGNLGINVFIAKVTVEVVLFLVSFSAQRDFIFYEEADL